MKLKNHPTKLDLPKEKAQASLDNSLQEMAVWQDKLYAAQQNGVLIILQAMDAAGKDTTIKYAMAGLNPQGCVVQSFKQPTKAELAHDFLWRSQAYLPAKGMISIFNRSYYEDVLVVKVHPDILAKQGLTPDAKLWKQRYESIRDFEKHLTRNGTAIVKIFLHLSKAEQKARFLERLENKDKNWKFSSSDLQEREYWDEYQKAYQDMIDETSTKQAPWHCIPADNKWAARAEVAKLIVRTLKDLDPAYPRSADAGAIRKAKSALS